MICNKDELFEILKQSLDESPFKFYNVSLLASKNLKLRKDFTRDRVAIIFAIIFMIQKIFVTMATLIDKKFPKISPVIAAFSTTRNAKALLETAHEDKRLHPIHGLK